MRALFYMEDQDDRSVLSENNDAYGALFRQERKAKVKTSAL
jgi:hypothetical protein